MSELTQNIVVQPNDVNITVDTNNINFTPSGVNMNIYAGGIALAGGSTGQIQYNYGGVLAGIPTVTYFNGNINLGDAANVQIEGGTNGYVLQTDGTGNLSWTAQSGGGGNGSPGGANTQIQYNDAGSFGGTTGFTFNKVTGNVSMPGNLAVVGLITGTAATANHAVYANEANSATIAYTVVTNAQPNITSTGTLVALTVNGTTTIQQAQEKFTPITTPTSGSINYDLLDQAIIFHTANAIGNYTLNFRGNSITTLNSIMSSNQSMTCTFLVTNASIAYVVSAITIDGATPTVKWTSPGSAGVGTTSGNDIYNFNILKTAANTFTVFASRVGYA